MAAIGPAAATDPGSLVNPPPTAASIHRYRCPSRSATGWPPTPERLS